MVAETSIPSLSGSRRESAACHSFPLTVANSGGCVILPKPVFRMNPCPRQQQRPSRLIQAATLPPRPAQGSENSASNRLPTSKCTASVLNWSRIRLWRAISPLFTRLVEVVLRAARFDFRYLFLWVCRIYFNRRQSRGKRLSNVAMSVVRYAWPAKGFSGPKGSEQFRPFKTPVLRDHDIGDELFFSLFQVL